MTEARRTYRKMITRKMQLWDLIKVWELLTKNLKMKFFNVVACLIHFVFDIPLRSLGLGTIFGSIAQMNDGKIVGLIIARRFPLAKKWVLGPIVVDKHYRGYGIGTGIMQLTLRLLQDKKANGALVSISNTRRHSAARRLFHKFGFRVIEKVFTNANQAYAHARMISQGRSLYTITQEKFLNEPKLKISQKVWYIFFRELHVRWV